MIKAVIFDMDGVISDTDRTRFQLLKVLLAKRRLVLHDRDYKKSVGKRTRTFLAEMFPDDLSKGDIEVIYHERKAELHSNPERYVIAQPHITECLKELFDGGFTLSIATVATQKDIEVVLSKIGIMDFFTFFVSSDDIIHMKPHPEIYLKSVEKLGFEKRECVAIEDSPVGVESAKNAGIFCIGVCYTHKREELSKADVVVENLSEITPAFIQQHFS